MENRQQQCWVLGSQKLLMPIQRSRSIEPSLSQLAYSKTTVDPYTKPNLSQTKCLNRSQEFLHKTRIGKYVLTKATSHLNFTSQSKRLLIDPYRMNTTPSDTVETSTPIFKHLQPRKLPKLIDQQPQ